MDIVFIVDSSGSIGRKNFNTMKDVLLKLVRHFSVSESYARVAIVQYATTARRIFSLHKSQQRGFLELQRSISRMHYSQGGTKTGKALNLAARMLRNSKRRVNHKIIKHYKVLIIFICRIQR